MYRYELHAHTKEVSPCASIPAKELVDIYMEKGYAGVVITDHFNDYVLESYTGTGKEKVDRYLSGYREAFEYGKARDFLVLLGAECHLCPGNEDFLLYGIDERYLYEHEKMYEMSQDKLYEACRAYKETAGKDIVLVQAHPCRRGNEPRDARYLDGVEAYNGNPRQMNNNSLAEEFSNMRPDFIKTAGSDFHQYGDEAHAGIETNGRIHNNEELIRVLRSGNYKLIKE